MRTVIEPGKKRKSINFLDSIVYSEVKDLNGNPMKLEMSVMLQNGNSEMRFAAGIVDEEDKTPKPCIVWVPGGGYRGCDKNLMVAEMTFLADRGYVVASIYYRSSAEGHMPDQIIDVKTAIRFLRAHAAEYEIDPNRIGIIGRSAGGHLASLAGMNVDDFHGSEWASESDEVQACVDMFGPVDIPWLLKFEESLYKADPANYRWENVAASHGGAVMGGEYNEDMIKRAEKVSSPYLISDKMCPMMIMHGDIDKLVPVDVSEDFYQKIIDAGQGDKADLYILHNAGHGTKDFFQDSVKELIAEFFDRNLKNQ
ncbi:Acetyl esterase/lipase [Oribacterium sp. KHPX15]|uniref:alpha/beta hydrolase n=1 Tax=Oribacterium sp. KHPX15 TaxID=1855342 RepID=UPI000897BBE0|nr:alpha/beta hydrolase [Oribacterium sp. KHPX15]SDZ81434.1 Acetyl esterase/lipase [Oribacterium sp. KHPX15]